MALPDLAALKRYVKKQTSEEDTLLASILLQAKAMAAAFVRRPIIAEERTFVLDHPSQYPTRSVGLLHLPIYPVAEESSDVTALVITDNDGDELVVDTDYRLDLRTGRITGINFAFGVWPYTVVATVGLSAYPEYEDQIEPVISAAILDIAADLYQRRNPAATNESTGGGVSTSYAGGIPERVKDMLRPFVMARALG
jgi:hypothetical protein